MIGTLQHFFYSADSVVSKPPKAHPLAVQGYPGRTPLAVCVHSTRSATAALLSGTSVEDTSVSI